MIYVNNVPINTWKFPAGETGVNVKGVPYGSGCFNFQVDFRSNDDIINLLLAVNAVKNAFAYHRLHLRIPYFPYARQDRVCSEGDSFSLQVVVDLIKSCGFDSVLVTDPHSEVLQGMFPAGTLRVIKQHKALLSIDNLNFNSFDALISPDAGATKKIYSLAKELNLPVIEARKERNPQTGEIVCTSIPLGSLTNYKNILVVDDICDGGRTFIELAKAVRKEYNAKLSLAVTHGIFSKGLDCLYEHFDVIYSYNDMRI